MPGEALVAGRFGCKAARGLSGCLYRSCEFIDVYRIWLFLICV